jgi:hypothetical protein
MPYTYDVFAQGVYHNCMCSHMYQIVVIRVFRALSVIRGKVAMFTLNYRDFVVYTTDNLGSSLLFAYC